MTESNYIYSVPKSDDESAGTGDAPRARVAGYTLNADGSRQEFDANLDVDSDDDDDYPVAQSGQAAFHPDGSRAWRFKPEADPRQWSNLAYIDEHVDEVIQLGWIEPNPPGNQWTVEDQLTRYLAWEKEATAPYRQADTDDGDVDVQSVVSQPLSSSQSGQGGSPPPPVPQDTTVPRAPTDTQATDGAQGNVPKPPPPPPTWGRPEDPIEGGTQFSDVMAELRQRVPESDGLWSATKAAQIYGDTDFIAESGLTDAMKRVDEAGDALHDEQRANDGAVSAGSMIDALQARTDYAKLQAEVDSTSNRYQQTTGYQPQMSLEQQQASLDEGLQAAIQQIGDDPASLGVGVTNAQQISRAEVFEYMSLTGAELDPGQPLTDEQRAQLASLRQQQQDEAMARQQAWEQSPEGQQALAEQQLRVDQLEGQEDRVAQSRARAEQIMETPVDER